MNKSFLVKFIWAIILMSSHSTSYAILEFEDAAFPELITSSRALAIGNAYLSKVDDSWSAFYNPAGLGTVRGINFHLTNVHLEYNEGLSNITTGNGAITDSTENLNKISNPYDLRTLLALNPGTLVHSRLNTFPNITIRGLTLGYMYSRQTRARLKSLTDDYEFAQRTDFGPVAALSLSLWGGIIKFGGSAIFLTREQVQKDFAPTEETVVERETDYKQGKMTLINAGTRITLPWYMLPAFSLVVRNSSNNPFGSPGLSGLPDKIPSTVDGAFSLTPYIGKTTRLHFEVDVRDIGNRYEDVPKTRKTQFGFEFDWHRIFFFRLGFGDGWGSGGVGVRKNSFTFDLTTYAIEVSPDGYREDEDRRTVLSFSQGF